MIILDDFKTYNSLVKHRRFAYYKGLPIVLAISLARCCVLFAQGVVSSAKHIVDIVYDLQHLNDPYEETCITPYFKKAYEKHYTRAERTQMFFATQNENYVKKDKEVEETISSPSKARALANLRDYLLFETPILEGVMLKTVHPRVTCDDLYEAKQNGTKCKACLVQHITFGNRFNQFIHDAFGYEVKKNKTTNETYLVFNDGETYDLERTLQETYNCDKIILKLIDAKQKEKGE